ncbi:MAG: anthranilate synthase component I family protein [Candidatus Jacksonbacteria bacterium]|nr:anthranilate synthase component I family protein [Candidatus Jacksonbacteria bacterium]
MKKLNLHQKPTYAPFPDTADFYGLFQKIHAETDACFFLESLGPESASARYSIIGFLPKHIIRSNGTTLTVDGKRIPAANPYYSLREITPQNILSRAYSGGLVGYLGYDAVSFFEKTLFIRRDPRFPSFMFGVYTDGLVFDSMTGETFYFFYNENRLDFVKKIAKMRIPKTTLLVKEMGDGETRETHRKMVSAAKEEIKEGRTFQVEIGFKTEYEIHGSPIPIYTQLRLANPSPYMFYLKFGSVVILGAGPELLFRLRDREMETYPLAGTAPRGKNSSEDREFARALLNDPKEIAEHNMLIDLHRNDLGKAAEFGTVKVRRLKDIKKFSHVQHISSEIAGVIKKGEDMFSGLAANFPAGTLSGAPKIESMKIIDRLEKAPRGPYGGAAGHFGFNGDCAFAIPIRSLFISGNYAYSENASGIVHDSSEEREYDEVKRKGEAMRKVLRGFVK